MKIFTLSLVLLFNFNIAFASTPVSTEDPVTIVVHIDNLSVDDNLSIHDLFNSDSRYDVVNSCQILGLIVIRSSDDNKVSLLEAEGYILKKLSVFKSSNSVEILKSKSSGEVSKSCRAKVASIENK